MEVKALHRPCEEHRAALEEAQKLLDITRTRQREQAMKVGGLLDDQRTAANAQARMELVELGRLLAETHLEISFLREDLAVKPDAKAIEEAQAALTSYDEKQGQLSRKAEQVQKEVEQKASKQDLGGITRQVLECAEWEPEYDQAMDTWTMRIIEMGRAQTQMMQKEADSQVAAEAQLDMRKALTDLETKLAEYRE